MAPLTLLYKTALILLILLKVSLPSLGQISVQGTVHDIAENPLPFTNIVLLNAADSSLIGGTVSDAKGAFTFDNVKTGSYLINTLMVGYQSTHKTLEIGETQASIPLYSPLK
jgi:hypothetical protein